MTQRFVSLVMFDVDPSVDLDEFNRWYDSDHLPTRVACPGTRSGLRYVADGSTPGSPQFAVIYEADDLDAFDPEKVPELKAQWGWGPFEGKVKIRQPRLVFVSTGPFLARDDTDGSVREATGIKPTYK